MDEPRRAAGSPSPCRPCGPAGLSPDVAENILRVSKTGFTLVPEAGTDRLRRVINKHLTNEDILDAAGHAFARGWKLLKLYFMVGLPTETEADLDGDRRAHVRDRDRVGAEHDGLAARGST